MKNAAFLFLAFALMAGILHGQQAATEAQAPASEIAVTGEDELVKEKGPFQETWVRPDADVSRYSKLFIWDPVFHFRDIEAARANTTSAMMLRGDEGPYGVRGESQAKFEQIVDEAFAKEFHGSKMFAVVDAVGPGTLIVRPGVLDIVSNVPPNYTGRNRLYLTSVGEATIFFELIDAETGVVQARVAERREIQPIGTSGGRLTAATPPTNPASVWMDVERWAGSAARDLRKELEKALKKADKS